MKKIRLISSTFTSRKMTIYRFAMVGKAVTGTGITVKTWISRRSIYKTTRSSSEVWRSGLAAFLYAVSMLLKYVVAGLAAAGLAFCAEYLLAALVPVTGAFNYLKCMNPFFCWDMGNTFGVYCNLNLFGMPAGKGGCAAAAASALFFAASCGGILAFVRTYQVTTEGWLAHFCNALRKRCACLTRHASILFYEWYKVFVQQKKWVVFAALLIWGIHESYAAAQPEILTNMPEIAYYNYMLQLSGKVTDEKLEWIEKEGERLDSLQARCIKLMGEPGGGDSVELMALRSEYESLYQGYQYLESQVQGLKGRPGSIYGKYLMDERAYIRQWTGIRQDLAVWMGRDCSTLGKSIVIIAW